MFNWLLGVNAIGRKPSFEQRANFVDQGTINSSKLKASTLNRASRFDDTCGNRGDFSKLLLCFVILNLQ